MKAIFRDNPKDNLKDQDNLKDKAMARAGMAEEMADAGDISKDVTAVSSTHSTNTSAGQGSKRS